MSSNFVCSISSSNITCNVVCVVIVNGTFTCDLMHCVFVSWILIGSVQFPEYWWVRFNFLNIDRFSSIWSLDWFGRRRDMMDDSEEILFQSFLWEATVSRSGMGRNVHSLTLSLQRFLCRPRRRPLSKVPWRMILERLSWQVTCPTYWYWHVVIIGYLDSVVLALDFACVFKPLSVWNSCLTPILDIFGF